MSSVITVPPKQPAVNPAFLQGRILQLDGLRGLAVLLVMLHHYSYTIPPSLAELSPRYLFPFRLGWCGVDLFFVLSGFLIGGILLDAKSSDSYFRTFYLRRFHRIFPLYYLWISLCFVLAWAAYRRIPAPLTMAAPSPGTTLTYFFFLQNSVPKTLPAFSAEWLGPLWSLAVEEQFYLVMPLIVWLCSRRRLVQLLLTTIAVAPLVRVIAHYSPAHTAQYVSTPCRADALAIGVLLAVALRDEQWRARLIQGKKWLYLALGVLFAGVLYLLFYLYTQYTLGMALWGFTCLDWFFAGIMLLALIAPQGLWANFCRWSPLRRLGGISYCIYVIHLAIYALCRFFFTPNGVKVTLPRVSTAVMVAAALTLLVASISWRFLESPMIRRGHAYRY